MADLILHHYEGSPFAHKIRAIFGFKGLAWRSVEIPMIMPKPDLMPLSGGYRRTPVMQVGADIYHDTQLIAAELERRHPAPTLYPAGGEGLAHALTFWADGALFGATTGAAFAHIADKMPAGLFRRPGRHARAGAGYAGEDHGRRAPAGRGVEPHAPSGRGLAGRRPALPARRRRRARRLLDLPSLLDGEPGGPEECGDAGALPPYPRLGRADRGDRDRLAHRHGFEGGA